MSYILCRAKPVVGTKTMFGRVHFWIEGSPPKKTKKTKKKAKMVPIGEALIASMGATDGRSFSMPYEEFFRLVYYVLKNEDLRPDDERIIFLQTLKKAKIVPGWNFDKAGIKSRRIKVPDFKSHGEE